MTNPTEACCQQNVCYTNNYHFMGVIKSTKWQPNPELHRLWGCCGTNNSFHSIQCTPHSHCHLKSLCSPLYLPSSKESIPQWGYLILWWTPHASTHLPTAQQSRWLPGSEPSASQQCWPSVCSLGWVNLANKIYVTFVIVHTGSKLAHQTQDCALTVNPVEKVGHSSGIAWSNENGLGRMGEWWDTENSGLSLGSAAAELAQRWHKSKMINHSGCSLH